MSINNTEQYELVQQKQYDLINAIRASMLVLSNQSTMANQTKFFGKYMADAPKTKKPESAHEFSYEDLFFIVFKKDIKLGWNTADILLNNQNDLTNFYERYFVEVLQLDFDSLNEGRDGLSYAYKWQLDEKVKVVFTVDTSRQSNDITYPENFYQVIISRV